MRLHSKVWGLQLKTRRTCSGFNMVEILVALALLAIGIYSAADLITSARRTSGLTHDHMQADALARLKVEEIRSAGENLTPLFPNGTTTIDLPAQGRGTYEQNPRYTWNAHLSLSPGTTQSVEIAVDVTRANDTESTTALAQARGMVLLTSTSTRNL